MTLFKVCVYQLVTERTDFCDVNAEHRIYPVPAASSASLFQVAMPTLTCGINH